MLRRISLLFALVYTATTVQADWDMFQSYAILDFGDGNEFRAGGFNADGNATINTYHYGFFRQGDTFVLNGGELKTYKNGSSNVCGGTLQYRVYKECESPGAFNSIALAFESNLGGGDQRWQTTNAAIDLLTGLSKGDYVLEVFWEANGNQNDPAGCGELKYDSNFGGNYLAYFSVGEDGFEDSDFTNGAAWQGDAASFSVIDPSGLSGDGSNVNINNYFGRNPDVLVSNASAADAALVLPSAQAYGVWEFSVATGLNWLPSATNNFAIILVSDDNTPANLQLGSMNFNGYFLKWKSDVAGDSFGLFRQDGTTETELIDLAYPLAFDAYSGYTVKVVRTSDGAWRIYADQGFDNTDATTQRAFIRDNSITSSSYFAVSTNIANPSAARRLYFDHLMFGDGTEVGFASAQATIEEADSDTTYDIVLNISDEDDRCATSFEVALLSGDAARIGNYTTQTVTFPAGDNTPKTVSITVSGNNACERDENLVFVIQNISGGCESNVGINATFTLTLEDDESGTDLIFSENFEDGDAAGWINATQWDVISSAGTIRGEFDLRHTNLAGASDYISHSLGNLELRGAETTWRFNMKHSGFETSANNWLMTVIAGNEADAFSSTLDGYAVGVNFASATDNLKLVRIDNGSYTDLIVSTYDWNTSVVLGVEVVRDENGTWQLSYQEGNGFDALTAAGTVSDNQYPVASFFSFACQVTIGNVNKCRIDDITVEQYGCYSTYYSVGTGNSNDPIWSLDDPLGAGASATFGRFKNVVLQSGYSVDLTGDLIARNLTIDATGSLNGAAADIKVYGDWSNNGSFNPQTSSVSMKGEVAQSIGGASASDFYDLHVDNRASGVTLNASVNMQNVLFPDQGTLDVNGQVLTLISDALGTGSIGAFNTDSDLLGEITLQRYIPSGVQSWVNVGAPLTGLTIADWNDDIITTGFPGADDPAYPLSNIQKYDESINGALNDGWENTTADTDALLNDRGYMVLMLSGAQNIDMTGGIQKGNISQPISYNPYLDNTVDGWNLVVNRYPSEIDWDALANASPGVSTYYIYDAESGAYLSRNGLTQVGSAPRYIAAGQSFWAKADAAGASLEWSEAIKSSSGQSFERAYDASSFLAISISGNGNHDEAFISFHPEATNAYENTFDAYKLGSVSASAPSIASVDGNGDLLAINTLSNLETSLSIPLAVSTGTQGQFTLSVSQLHGIPETSCISIEDTEDGSIYPLHDDLMIEFNLSAEENSNRFIVHFSAPVEVSVTPATCAGDNNASITLNAPELGSWSSQWFNEYDELMATTSGFTGEYMLGDLPEGNYTLILTNEALSCASIETTVTVLDPQVQSIDISHDFNFCDLGDQGWIEINVANASAFDLEINSGDLQNAFEINAGNHILDQLENGVYEVTVSTGCLSETHLVVLNDPNAVSIETPDVVMATLVGGSANIVVEANAENATSITWTLNGDVIGEGLAPTLTFIEEGEFEVIAQASSELCSASDHTLIVVDDLVEVEHFNEESFVYINGSTIMVMSPVLQENLQIDIFNTQGQLVASIPCGSIQGLTSFELPALAGGAYIAHVTDHLRSVARVRFVR